MRVSAYYSAADRSLAVGINFRRSSPLRAVVVLQARLGEKRQDAGRFDSCSAPTSTRKKFMSGAGDLTTHTATVTVLSASASHGTLQSTASRGDHQLRSSSSSRASAASSADELQHSSHHPLASSSVARPPALAVVESVQATVLKRVQRHPPIDCTQPALEYEDQEDAVDDDLESGANMKRGLLRQSRPDGAGAAPLAAAHELKTSAAVHQAGATGSGTGDPAEYHARLAVRVKRAVVGSFLTNGELQVVC